MNVTPEQKKRAGRAVAARIRDMNTTVAAVARAAGVSPATIRALISGRRWPSDAVQGRVEQVLRWQPGGLVARAVVDDAGTLDVFSSATLAAELAYRLAELEAQQTRLRSTDT